MAIDRTYGFKKEEKANVLGDGRETFVKVEVDLPAHGLYDISDYIIKTGGIRCDIDIIQGVITTSNMTITLDNTKRTFNLMGEIKGIRRTMLGQVITVKFGFSLIPNDTITIFTGTVESTEESDNSTISIRLRSEEYLAFKKSVFAPITYAPQHCISIILDIILNKMKIPAGSVDLADIENLRTMFPYTFSFMVEELTDGIALIEDRILNVIGGWIVVNERGLLTIDVIRPKFGQKEDYDLSDSVNIIHRKGQVRLADLTNIFAFRYRDLKGNTQTYTYTDQASVTKYRRERTKSISAEAMVCNLDGYRSIALRQAIQLSNPIIEGEYDVKLDLIACQIGDIVRIDAEQYWMIIGMKKELDKDNITINIIDVSSIFSVKNWAFLGSEVDEGDGLSPQPDNYSSATEGQKAFCYLKPYEKLIY